MTVTSIPVLYDPLRKIKSGDSVSSLSPNGKSSSDALNWAKYQCSRFLSGIALVRLTMELTGTGIAGVRV
jgi:hypothetical protein